MISIIISFLDNLNTSIDLSCTDGDVRLVGGINEAEGRVEICKNKIWGNVCHNSWGASDADVVCKQLGYKSKGQIFMKLLIILNIIGSNAYLYFHACTTYN